MFDPCGEPMFPTLATSVPEVDVWAPNALAVFAMALTLEKRLSISETASLTMESIVSELDEAAEVFAAAADDEVFDATLANAAAGDEVGATSTAATETAVEVATGTEVVLVAMPSEYAFAQSIPKLL